MNRDKILSTLLLILWLLTGATEASDVRARLVSSECTLESVYDIPFQQVADQGGTISPSSSRWLSWEGNMVPYFGFRYVGGMYEYDPASDFDATTYISSLLTGFLPTANVYVSSTEGLGWLSTSVFADCVRGRLAVGTIVSTLDGTQHPVYVGGHHVSFVYQFGHHHWQIKRLKSPWTAEGGGGLRFRIRSGEPFYYNFGGNPGGQLNITYWLHNTAGTSERIINGVNVVYQYNDAQRSRERVWVDDTTKAAVISSYHGRDTVYSTSTEFSALTGYGGAAIHVAETQAGRIPAGHFSDLFELEIRYDDLAAALSAMGDTSSPEDWVVSAVNVQYELADEGEAVAIARHYGFEVEVLE